MDLGQNEPWMKEEEEREKGRERERESNLGEEVKMSEREIREERWMKQAKSLSVR